MSINKIIDNLNQVIFNIRNLKEDVNELATENIHLYDLLYNMELQTNNVNQYMQCNNSEIRNISEKIYQNFGIDLYQSCIVCLMRNYLTS